MILSKKYNEEINHIRMNEDMKKRILQNVLAANQNDSSTEENIKVKPIIKNTKKNNSFKRNMHMAAAGFAVVLVLSAAKNLPMLYKNTPSDFEKNEAQTIQGGENNNIINSDDSKLENNNHIKESSDNKNEQAISQSVNGDNYLNEQNSNSLKNEENNTNLKIKQEEKPKDNVQSSSISGTENSQTQKNEEGQVLENSNVSLRAGSEETNSNSEANNEIQETVSPKMAEANAADEEVKENRILKDDSDNSPLETQPILEQAAFYFQEYSTIDEAEKSLNFKINPLKILPNGLKMESISSIGNEIIQVQYSNDTQTIIFRAGIGIENISGDYNIYKVQDITEVNGTKVNLQGNEAGKYSLATWEKDGISYSISVENGIDKKTILDMI